MLPGRKRVSMRTVTQNSTVASKIKTKILNTSSFFKVSLKTNNKALALALVAQKEKSRQLETENVQLRKQVEALCFDTAIRRHKHNQLIRILKDLHRNTLDNLGKAFDLFSTNNDALELSEDHNKRFPDNEDNNIQMERVEVQISRKSEQLKDSMCVLKQKSLSQEVIVKDNTVSTNHSGTQSRSSESNTSKDSTNEMKTQQEESLKSTQRTPSQSKSLRQSLDHWSQFYTDVGPDTNAAVSLENYVPSVISTTGNQQPSGAAAVIVAHPTTSTSESTLEPGDVQEKTMLHDTEMEMTISDSAAEIVTVETKPKKPGKDVSNRLKKKKEPQTKSSRPAVKGGDTNRGPSIKSENLEMKTSVNLEPMETVTSEAPLHTDNRRVEGIEKHDENFTETWPIETESLSARRKTHITSRFPKPSRPACDSQKTKQSDKRQSFMISVPSKPHKTASPDLFKDDYFNDFEVQSSEFIKDWAVSLDEDVTEDKSTKMKCRRTYVKSNSQTDNHVKTKTYMIPDEAPSRKGRKTVRESRKTKTVSETEDDACLESPQKVCTTALPESSAAWPESGDIRCSSSATKPQTSRPKSKRPTYSNSTNDQSHRVKCRGTFEMSSTRDSSLLNSTISDACAEKLLCSPSSGRDVIIDEESEAVRHVSTVEHQAEPHLDHSLAIGNRESLIEKTQATQGPPVDLEGLEGERLEEMPLGNPVDPASVIAMQKPKKARKEETAKSRKKAASKDNPSVSVKEEKKKKRSRTQAAACPLSGQTFDNQGNTCVDILAQDANSVNSWPVKDKDTSQVIVHSITEEISEADVCSFSVDMPCPDLKVSRTCSLKSQTNQGHKPRCRSTFVVPMYNDYTGNRENYDDAFTNNRTSDVSTAETHTHVPDSHSGKAVLQSLRELLTDERPPWEALDVSSTETELDGLVSSPIRAASHEVAVHEECAESVAEASPAVAGRALKMLTNTNWTDNEDTGRTRRRGAAVSYKEPTINCKMRRGDKFSDTMFLSSPIFKDTKKEKEMKKKKKEIKKKETKKKITQNINGSESLDSISLVN